MTNGQQGRHRTGIVVVDGVKGTRVMRIPGWLSDQPSLVGCTVTRQVIEAVVAFQHFPLPVRVTVISVDAGKIPTLEKEADQRQISSLLVHGAVDAENFEY